MKKMQKILIFENIHVDVISEHPKDISRCKVKLTEGSNNEGQQLYATHFSEEYGIVEPTSITWPSSISFQYHAQESIEFQTVCEHEFGYELADLKAIYKGIIYLKSQNFFRESTAHIFNNQGQQCGLVKFIIKIQNKIIKSAQQKQKPIEVEIISTELIARITLYSANLLLNPAYYYLQKDNMSLIVLYGKQEILSSKENNFMKWNFNKQKLSIMGNNNEITNIQFIIQQNNVKIMNGFLQLKQLEEKKRFLIQNINMQLNTTGNKIGTLQIDMRYITKKQLFDLMYLPTQLTNKQQIDKNIGQNAQQSKNKMKNSYQSLRDLQIKINKSNSTVIHEKNKFTIKKNNKNNQSLEINNLQINNNDILKKYKIYLMKPNNQSMIPKDKRFRRAHGQTINQNISYIDPQKISDFSPRHKRGSSITTSNKTDFTKFVKMNPGVGKYHLPSIWQK